MSETNNGGPAFPAEQGILQKGMTLRQYAAIKLRVPNSGTDWLDEMIRVSLRDEFAAQAMQAIISGCQDSYLPMTHSDDVAEAAFVQADAVLTAREASK